ncbi:MAG: hypothetical protein Q4F39_02195 [Bacteroidia bacterium]|nr:hypothetical protein [Bacteroidia bacterium]
MTHKQIGPMPEKLPYVSPCALLVEMQGVRVLCSSFGSSSNEGMGRGNSYDDYDYD